MSLCEIVEYKNWGLNFFTISFFIVFLFLILESFGLSGQLAQIRKKDDCRSISQAMFLFLTFYFFSSLIYGLKILSLLLVLNGLLGFFTGRISYELIKRRGLKRKELVIICTCAAAVILMLVFPIKGFVYLVFMFGSVIALLEQAHEIIKEKSPGVVDARLIMAYFLSTLFFVYYSIVSDDVLLIIATSSTLFSIVSIIAVYVIFALRENNLRKGGEK